MHIYPKQTPSPYLLETSLPGAEKGEKNKLFASLIFQEKRQGGEQYLGLKPGLHSSPDCSLLELHRGEREKKKKKPWLPSSPAQPRTSPSLPLHLGERKYCPPLPLNPKPLWGPGCPLTLSWLVDSSAIPVRDAPKACKGRFAVIALFGVWFWLT